MGLHAYCARLRPRLFHLGFEVILAALDPVRVVLHGDFRGTVSDQNGYCFDRNSGAQPVRDAGVPEQMRKDPWSLRLFKY